MRLCSGIFFISLLAFPLQAQQQPFTGKIDVSLVNVDVTVIGHGGAIRGLTRDDFEVFEDGVPQPLTNFYEITGGTPASSPAGPAASAPPSSDDPFRRHVLLLIDNTHLTRYTRNRALESLEKFINDRFTGGEYDWSIAVVDTGLHVVLEQTSDKAAIHKALDEIRRGAAREVTWGRGDLSCPQNLGTSAETAVPLTPLNNTPMTLCDMSALVEAHETMMNNARVQRSVLQSVRGFSGTPGRKLLLVLTNSLGLPDEVPRFNGLEVARGIVQVREAIVREANASNVSIYVFNAKGLTAPGGVDSGPYILEANQIYYRHATPTDLSNMYWVAEQTGGRLMPGNSPDVSVRQFDEASSSFYSLAYRPPHPEDGSYHHIKVRLKKSGRYDLHYRDGYAAIPRDLELVRALQTPMSAVLQSSTLPVSATTGDVRALAKGIEVPIEARVPLKDLQFMPGANGWNAYVDVYVSIFDENGRNLALQHFTTTASALNAVAEGDLIHNAKVRLESGRPRTIVVAVRDKISDAVGLWRQSVDF
jgi:VWFA-related protein